MRARLAGMGAVGLATLLMTEAPVATAQVAPQTSIGRTTPDTKWVVDMVHSQVGFGVRHLVGRVRGAFDKWYAVLTTKESDWKQGTVKVSVQTASLNTGNAYRDADLRSERFFDVQRYPKLTFEGTEFAVADSTLTVSSGRARIIARLICSALRSSMTA